MIEPSHCPNALCRHHHPPHEQSEPLRESGRFFLRKGSYARANESRVARFLCRACGRHFSEQTFRANYRFKKPELDAPVAAMRNAGVSQRAASRLLRISRQTVARRYRWPRSAEPVVPEESSTGSPADHSAG